MACSLIQFSGAEITHFTFKCIVLKFVNEFCFTVYPTNFSPIGADLVTVLITEKGQLSFLCQLGLTFQ